MIVSGIIYLLYWLLSGLVMVLPTTQALPSQIDNALNFFIPKFSAWNAYIPLSDILTVFGLVLSIELSIWTFHGIDWTYKKFRG